ncbi:hypothetical protein D3C87_1599310 [compost metagenome]
MLSTERLSMPMRSSPWGAPPPPVTAPRMPPELPPPPSEFSRFITFWLCPWLGNKVRAKAAQAVATSRVRARRVKGSRMAMLLISWG